jgi:hypothetical protein
MDEIDKSTTKGVLIIVFCVLMLGLLGLTLEYSIKSYIVTAKVDGVVVFHGKKACLNIESGGASTTLTIRKGPFCLFPSKTLTSSHVTVESE